MPKAKPDPVRNQRIELEIVADAYDSEERAMGWYYYLEEKLRFPFGAVCIAKRPISPLQVKDRVEVVGMPSENECGHEMFVTIRWQRRSLAVPLAQLRPVPLTDQQTRQAVDDWHYWVNTGSEF